MVSSRLYPQTLDKTEKNWRTNPLAYFATTSVIEEKSFITLALGHFARPQFFPKNEVLKK
jgi:hypothetical protein